MTLLVISSLLRFSILIQTEAAHFPNYLRKDITTARMEDYLVEEDLLPGPPVSNGSLSLAPGVSHTLSGRRYVVICPGPQHQEFISLEVTEIVARQRR